MSSRRQFLAASAATLAMSGSRRVLAQASRKPVRIIVGFTAGGGTDVLARLLAEKLRGHYAPAVIVENRPGAAARLATEYVKNADPDGSVLLFTPDFPLTVYPHSYKTLSYDPVNDFTPVAPCAKSMLTLNVGPAVPETVKTASDFVRWCQANPARAQYGTTGAGATPHFVGVMLSRAAGLELTAVHYKGGAPALQDLLGGHVPASVNPISEVMPFANTGTLRTLAVTGSQRSRFMPQVPTMVESGYKDVIVQSWLGFIAPAKVPADTIAALSAVLRDATNSPDIIDSFAKVGNETDFKTPAEFAVQVKEEVVRWGPVVKASGFVAED
jgi:tripartite-type tricarboxylate transporter receptor subunit TctC